MNLQLHQVQPRGAFGDRVLDLQAGVDLHEREDLSFGLIQEFHSPGIAITSKLAQAHSGVAKFEILSGRERGRRGFFENFLMAALDGAVAHAGGPSGSEIVSDDLDFDVASPRDQPFQKNCGSPKALKASLRADFECVRN